MPGTHVALTRSGRSRRPDATRVGEVDPAARVEVTVTTAPERFAKDSDEVGRILGQFGLSVEATFPVTGSIVLSGTAAEIEDAFRPRLGLYSHGPDGILRGREGDVHIPVALDG